MRIIHLANLQQTIRQRIAFTSILFHSDNQISVLSTYPIIEYLFDSFNYCYFYKIVKGKAFL